MDGAWKLLPKKAHVSNETLILPSTQLQLLGVKENGLYTEGEHEIAISYWESESAIAAWREDPEHQRAQQSGRERWYSDYTVEVVEVRRAYRHERDGWPATE